jgi:protoporphyrinogen oxidase
MGISGRKENVVIIGGGFTGLSAAYELARLGIGVTVLERDDEVGGIGGSFKTNGCRVDKFYHHFFTSDEDIIRLAGEIGLSAQLRHTPTKTSIYIGRRFYRLSSPLDLLWFKPLGLADRVRLGMLILRSRWISDREALESQTAEQWLIGLCGRRGYSMVWEPLLRAKFGSFAREVSAAWMWSRLVQRGGSRDGAGREVLGYVGGSFGAMAETLAEKIRSLGGDVQKGTPANEVLIESGCVRGVRTPKGDIDAGVVIATPALPVIAGLLEGGASPEYISSLRRIKYLANFCLILELSRPLSDIYWLNINDPDIPFTVIVEHTNFMPVESCGGRYIAYLSKYIERDSAIYNMSEKELLEFSVPHVRRIFAGFERSQILGYHVCKEAYAQPLIERHYNKLICPMETPVKGLYIATMAQVHPRSRVVNSAVWQGRQAAQTAAGYLGYSEMGEKK